MDALNTFKPWLVSQDSCYSLPQNSAGHQQPYELTEGEITDYQAVLPLYHTCSVPGYEVGRIQVIQNKNLLNLFESKVSVLNTRINSSAFNPSWEVRETQVPLRLNIAQTLQLATNNYSSSHYKNVKFLPMFHGTKEEALKSICETGFANLATTDFGYFGKGIYNSSHAEYAYRVYSDGTLLLNWVAFYSPFPVVRSDMSFLARGANYSNYDAHYALVVPYDKVNTEAYVPLSELQQKYQYDELVVFESSQVLPRYLITLTPQGLKLKHIGNQTEKLNLIQAIEHYLADVAPQLRLLLEKELAVLSAANGKSLSQIQLAIQRAIKVSQLTTKSSVKAYIENKLIDILSKNSFAYSPHATMSSKNERNKHRFEQNVALLQKVILEKNHTEAIILLPSYIAKATTDEQIIECYKFLFELFPNLDKESFISLEESVRHLLRKSYFLANFQEKLAEHLSVYYKRQGDFFSSMQCLAKAMQIRPCKEYYRLASKLLLEFLPKRLKHFIPTSSFSFTDLQSLCQEIEKMRHCCISSSDIQPFYLKALEYINHLEIEGTHDLEDFRDNLIQGLKTPIVETNTLMTERYWQALQVYRGFFDSPIKDVRTFQRDATQAFIKFFNVLLEDAFVLLGPAPCGYDIRAVGEIGREEICPDSKLQCFVLIEKKSQKLYFKRLLSVLEMQFAALGETKFNPFVFSCLKNSMPRGLRIDSLTLLLDDILVATPEDLAGLQLFYPSDEISYVPNLIKKNISLAKSSEGLYADYCKNSMHLINLQEEQKQAFTCMLSLKNIFFDDLWQNEFDSHALTCNIETHFLEPLQLLLGEMATYFNFLETNTLEIIQKLVEHNVFTPSSGKLLQDSISGLYALNVHLQFQMLKDNTHLTKGLQIDSSASPLEKEAATLLEKWYLLVLSPLYQGLNRVATSDTFIGVFRQFDLIQETFKNNINQLSPALISHIACHLSTERASIDQHLIIYNRLSMLDSEPLRQVYLDSVDSMVACILVDIPNRSGIRLSYTQNLQSLENAIMAITDELPHDCEDESVITITAPHFVKPRYLKSHVAAKIMNGNNLIPQYDCAHEVCRFACEEYDLHFKQMPYNPMTEFAVHSLTSRIAGKLTPASMLVRFEISVPNGTPVSIPVLISETITGKSLAIDWAKVKPNQSYTWTLLTSILTRPGDARLSNYQLNDQGLLYCVDNDDSFTEPVTKEKLFFSKINFCVAPFCLFPLDTHLDNEALKTFVELDAGSILFGWMEEIIERELEYVKLFSEEESRYHYENNPEKSFTPRILLRAGTTSMLYLQFWRLQNFIAMALNNGQAVTAGDLLKELISLRQEAVGEYIYSNYHKAKGATPGHRIKEAISRQLEQSLKSLQSRVACLGKVPTYAEIVDTQRYSLHMAREELYTCLFQRQSQYAIVKKSQGHLSVEIDFHKIKQDFSRQLCMLKVISEQTAHSKPEALVIHHCNILSGELLKPFLHKGLKVLDLRQCPKIDDSSIELIQKCCPQLRELTLVGCGMVKNITNEFRYLQMLRINRCSQLREIILEALALRELQCEHNPNLSKIDLTSCVANVEIKNCPKVDIEKSPKADITHRYLAFGKKQWEVFLNPGDSELPLPEDIAEILNQACPFWDGKRVRDTHMLILVPAGLSLDRFEKIKNVYYNNRWFSVSFSGYPLGKNFWKKRITQTQWSLVTKDVIPDSIGKIREDQIKLICQLAKRTNLPYKIFNALEASIAIFAARFFDEKIYVRQPNFFQRGSIAQFRVVDRFEDSCYSNCTEVSDNLKANDYIPELFHFSNHYDFSSLWATTYIDFKPYRCFSRNDLCCDEYGCEGNQVGAGASRGL